MEDLVCPAIGGTIVWYIYGVHCKGRNLGELLPLWLMGLGASIFGFYGWLLPCYMMFILKKGQLRKNCKIKIFGRSIDVRNQWNTMYKVVTMILESGQMLYIELEPIPVEVNNIPVEVEFDPLTPEQVQGLKQTLDIAINEKKLISMVVVVFVTLVLSHPLMAIGAGIMTWMMLFAKPGKPAGFLDREAEGRTVLTDGVYKAYKYFLGVGYSSANGWIIEGVLHLNYHFAGRTYLNEGTRMIPPVSCDEKCDETTYFGTTRRKTPEDGDRVEVIYVSPGGSVVGTKGQYQKISETTGIVRGPYTVPGVSGGACFGLYEVEGRRKKVFYGLTGTSIYNPRLEWWDDRDNWQVEFLTRSVYETGDVKIYPGKDSIIQVFAPTGAGKTQGMIPKLVQEGIANNQKVVISPPTRVICQEIYDKLESEGYTVHGGWSGGIKDLRADVYIYPHAVLLGMLWRNSAHLARKCLFIVDETHVKDSKTKCLLRTLRGRCSLRNDILIEMTATGNCEGRTVMEEGHNYPVQEIQVSIDEFSRMIIEEREKCYGQKCVVFCSSVHGKGHSIDKYYQEFKGYDDMYVVRFHRNTYELFQQAVRAPSYPGKYTVILTTNMCECGVNLDVDRVYDTGEQLKFLVNNGSVMGRLLTESAAQKVQRAGRAGRSKAGEVITALGREPVVIIDEENEIEEMEACLACGTIGIPMSDNDKMKAMTLGLPVTEAQVLKWLRGESQSLIGACMLYDELGFKRTFGNRLALYESWIGRGEAVKLAGRVLRLRHFDERDRAIFEGLERYRGAEVQAIVERMERSYECSRCRIGYPYDYGRKEGTRWLCYQCQDVIDVYETHVSGDESDVE